MGRGSTRDELLPAAILGLLALAAAGLILYAGRDTIFYYDEWDFVLGRRGTSLDTFLEPHVGHLSLAPILVYKALLATVGVTPYWPYRVVVVVLHLVCVALVYLIARRRLGAWAALAVAVPLLYLGSAWQVLLWPFEISYLLSLGAGLGAWLLLQEPDRNRDVAASLLVALALASSGVGVPVALGVLAGLLLQPGERRRAWLVAPPLALYLLWLATYGLPAPANEGVDLANLPDAPLFVADMAAAAAGGLSGMGEAWGRILITIAAIAVAVRVVWRGVPAWLGAGLVSAFAFWTLTALARADVTAPGTSRYLYPSAVFVLLVLAALPDGDGGWRGWRGWLGRRRSTWVLAALVVGWAALANVDPLRDGGRHLRSATGAIAPSLAAIEIGGDAIAAGERPQPQYAPQVGAGAYLDAVEEFGSALPDGAAGELGSAGDAAAVDAALQALEHIVLADGAERAAVGAPAPTVVQALGGRARRAGGCVRFAPRVQPAALDVEAPTGTALVVRNRGGTTAEVRLRRYGPDFPPQALGVIPPNAERALSLPSDSRGEPWVARISAAQPVTVCRAG